MNSSGIKRGLAVAAISALAVTGVPGAASAVTLATQEGGNTITIRSVAAGANASVVNDGTNTTVSLVATAGPNVQFVTFYYNTGGGDQKIGTASREATGEFQLEWAPPVGVANADIIARSTDAAGTAAAPAVNDTEAGVVISGTASTVEIAKPSAEVGYFDQPGGGAGAYLLNNKNVMAISGTTSQSGGNITTGAASVGIEPGTTFLAGTNAAGATSHSFTGTVNVLASAIDADPAIADQVLPVLTTANPGSSDAQGFNLYAQQIRDISATAAPVQPNSNTTTVTVTVKDQKGAPVAGALVKADNGNGGAPSNGGYTDGKGQVTFAGAATGAQSYFVETTDTSGYEVGVDYRTSITIGASTPSNIAFTSKDGNAFDIDEFDNGDTFIKVTDAAGTALPGQTFFYTWTFTPFDTTVDSQQTSRELSVATGDDGTALIALPTAANFTAAQQASITTLTTTGGTYTLNGYINRGTNPGQDAADLALAPQAIKVGESDVFLDGPTTTTRQLETTQNVSGVVALLDGTVLGGRTVSLSYATGDDSAFSATQPSGTTRLSNSTATAVTAADGTFTVSITDPDKTPNTPEQGTLSAVGTATVGSGANQKNGIGADAGTAAGVGYSAANDNVTIQFSADAAPKFITLTADTDTTPLEADPFQEIIDNSATPGRPVSFEINLSNSNSIALAGQQVTLKTDHGFFTPNVGAASQNDPSGLTADPAPAEGGLYGEWKSLGDTITVTTDAAGKATVTVAIERDAGFDDDGLVSANITATSGTATNGSPISIDFSTQLGDEALNPGKVTVQAADAQGNGVNLPDARVGQVVDLDVFAEDQFGNLVADSVVLSDDTSKAGFVGQAGNGTSTVVSQFNSTGSQESAFGSDDTVQTVKATWNQSKNTYTDGNAATPGFQAQRLITANNSVTDTADAINWYVVDFAQSTFTVTTDPEGPAEVGAPVVETVTVIDQKGQPVAGLNVAFIRQGPGDTTDGDPNNPISSVTNGNGQAFYAFTGTEPGVARISIVVDDTVQIKTLTDEVTIIRATGGELRDISAVISANNNGKKDDKLTVSADTEAQGAVVELFKKTKNGKRKIDQGTLDADGQAVFKIDDKNGKRFTKYFAKVLPTSVTNGDKTGTERVR